MNSWWRALARNKKATVGAAILLGFVVLALLGPLVVQDPTAFVAKPHQPPSWDHLFGTTGQGQDVLAQTVCGAGVTLAVGFAVGILVVAIGALVGVSSGYFGGLTDDATSIVTNVFLVIPGLPLAIILAAYLPVGPVSLTAVLVVSGWAWNARVFRSQTLALRRRDFVSAAVVAGETRARIILRELVPNMASLLVSAFIGTTIYAIGAQVGLEFLGLGDVGKVTWGTNLYWASNDATLLTGSWWILLPTGLCIALVGFGLTMLNFAIDEVTNPRLVNHHAGVTATPLPEARPGREAGAESEDVLMSIRHLTVTYPTPKGTVVAVDDVSFDLRKGEVFGLAGESGSGKSTIGQAILRILQPPAEVPSGAIDFDGSDVLLMNDSELQSFRWRDGSMVFQSAMNALNPVLSVGEQIADTLEAHGVTEPAEIRKRTLELLALVDIDARNVDAYPHMLSGGMRQRVVMAIALALKPRLVIMDEPTTALDVVVQKEILKRVIALEAELGFSILFISHDLPLMLSFADRVGILWKGKLVEVGEPDALRHGSKHPYTQRLMRSFPSLTGPRSERAANQIDPSAAPLLSIRGLSKSYPVGTGLRQKRRLVLNDVSLTLRRGEIAALVGESGCGKSTIARLLMRLEAPDAGSALFEGKEALGKERAPLEYRGKVQVVFQDPFGSLNPVHRVFHPIARPLLLHGRVAPDKVRARVLELLTLVGLEPAEDYIDRYPHSLSGGQRQRVAIARALAAEPRLIIADEPTSMLDVSIRMEILALFRRLADELGITILFITHDLASARHLADRIFVLYAGTIVEEGPSEELIGSPKHPYTRLLLSSVIDNKAALDAPVPANPGSAHNAPSRVGCPFASRCLDRSKLCDRERPENHDVGVEHKTRCHLYDAAGGGQPSEALS
jgi:oligopeptide/dipeptide ABC transporter ATP-binding protein